MNKTAKPLYTDPEDIKNYENRKRIRRNLITAIGGVGGGLTGASIGGGIGMGSAGPLSRSSGRRALLGALLGLGVGATAGALGGRKLNDLSVGYMESAGLDPTIPSLRAKLQKDAEGRAAVRSIARRVALEKRAGAGGLIGRAVGGLIGGGLKLTGHAVGGGMRLAGGAVRGTGHLVGRGLDLAARGVGNAAGGGLSAAGSGVQKYFSLLGGGKLGKYRRIDRALRDKVNKAVAGGLDNPAGNMLNARNYHNGMRGLSRLAPKMEAERRAVDAARGFTYLGLGGAGVGYGAYKALGSGAPAAEAE